MNYTKPLHFDVYGQLCILSVDDDSVNLMVMEQLLATFGWKIIAAVDCKEALAVLGNDIISAMDGEEALAVLNDKAWPDLIFLDFHMADGDSGDEICRKMRAIFHGVPVPIIMCTALSASSDAIQVCLQAGASDYLLKPYERAKVINLIDKYVGHKLRKQSANAPASAAAAAANRPQSPTAKNAPPPAPWQMQSHQPSSSVRTSAAAPSSPTTHTPSRLQPFVAAPGTADESSVQRFCTQLGLEYCGKKLADGGITFSVLSGMDDQALRKAGIVVKAQRDKLLDAISRLPG